MWWWGILEFLAKTTPKQIKKKPETLQMDIISRCVAEQSQMVSHSKHDRAITKTSLQSGYKCGQMDANGQQSHTDWGNDLYDCIYWYVKSKKTSSCKGPEFQSAAGESIVFFRHLQVFALSQVSNHPPLQKIYTTNKRWHVNQFERTSVGPSANELKVIGYRASNKFTKQKAYTLFTTVGKYG